MSVADVMMSSPARPPRLDACTMASSSSPDLPPLSEMFGRARRRPLRSGSNAAPIPSTASTTFTSAAALLRQASEIDIDTEKITYSPPSLEQSKRVRGGKGQTAKKKLHECVADEDIFGEVPSSQEKPWQKFKSKASSSEDGQSAFPKGRVTKPAAGETSRSCKKTDAVSRHFASHAEDVNAGVEERPSTPSQMHSEHAMARRLDWTPPENHRDANSSDNKELQSTAAEASTSHAVFKNLREEYACKGAESQLRRPSHPPEPIPDALKGRKRCRPAIEDVRASREGSPTKLPAGKKKIRTLTELATAPYAIPDIDLLAPGTKDSLLKYFDSDGAVKALVDHQETVMDMAKSKPKKSVKSRKRKSGTATNPILLSPNSALKQSSNQDFVFGTSSQLVVEDSPTVLKQIQIAIRTSGQADEGLSATSPTAQEASGKGLWHAGARDMDGDLLEAEVLDLIDDDTKDFTTNRPAAISSDTHGARQQHGQTFVDLHALVSSSPERTAVSTGQEFSSQAKSHFFQTQSDNHALRPESASSKPDAAPATRTTRSSPRPKYELLTDAQLAKQITKYGFKPVKKRQAMIALLDQCWMSQHPDTSPSRSGRIESRAAMSTVASAGSPSKATLRKKVTGAAADPISPKRPRGRPKKASKPTASTCASATAISPPSKRPRGRPKKTTLTDAPSVPACAAIDGAAASPSAPATPKRRRKATSQIVEIADSGDEEALDISPEHCSPSPPAIDTSISDGADTPLNISPTHQEEMLFSHITKAVTSAPRSTDPANPSWHEKMLLYDPVVLEDFTTWLNSGELTRVGYDGEVSPVEVKKWCESKSVICLWRVNLHGRERKRY